MIEIDYSRKNDVQGALLISDMGLYFHKYPPIKDNEGLIGDKLSIQQTGVFGAINLYKKMDGIEDVELTAKKKRDSLGLDSMILNGEIEEFSWESVIKIKKNWITGKIIIEINDGNKLRAPIIHRQIIYEHYGRAINT